MNASLLAKICTGISVVIMCSTFSWFMASSTKAATKYQYKVIPFKGLQDLEAKLNEAANAGWEFVQTESLYGGAVLRK
jgi:hypothetical protein